MQVLKITKATLLILTLFSVVACSSTSDEADPPVPAAIAGESGIDATTRRSQELEAEARARAAAAEERMMQAALNTAVFYFDFDVAEFRPADRDILTFHARELAANRNKSIRLEGHADERGTREYNIALGERRASSVMNYLIVNGAARSQLELVSFGEEQPEDRGQGEASHQRNRRVVIDSE
jgi:peptidoglycan-associated lipoprotein